MIDTAQALLERFGALNVYRHGERRTPHKPLLLLLANARLRQGQERLAYAEVEAALRPLLEAYAPPAAGRHSPDNPYWYLRNDRRPVEKTRRSSASLQALHPQLPTRHHAGLTTFVFSAGAITGLSPLRNNRAVGFIGSQTRAPRPISA
jgi:hypothetical protein